MVQFLIGMVAIQVVDGYVVRIGVCTFHKGFGKRLVDVDIEEWSCRIVDHVRCGTLGEQWNTGHVLSLQCLQTDGLQHRQQVLHVLFRI